MFKDGITLKERIPAEVVTIDMGDQTLECSMFLTQQLRPAKGKPEKVVGHEMGYVWLLHAHRGDENTIPVADDVYLIRALGSRLITAQRVFRYLSDAATDIVINTDRALDYGAIDLDVHVDTSVHMAMLERCMPKVKNSTYSAASQQMLKWKPIDPREHQRYVSSVFPDAQNRAKVILKGVVRSLDKAENLCAESIHGDLKDCMWRILQGRGNKHAIPEHAPHDPEGPEDAEKYLVMHRKGLKIILRDLDKHPLISALAALKARTSEIIESFEKIDELDQDVRAQMRRHRRALDTDGMASHLAGVQQKRSQGLKREAYDLIVSLTTDAVNLEGTLARAYELPYVPFTPPDTERMDYGVRRAEHGGKLVVDYLKEISAGCLSAAMVLYDQLGPDLPPTTPLGGGR